MARTKHVALSQIRWMIRRDLDEVLQIDALCFVEPWTKEVILTNLRQRNCIGMVIENGEDLLGFVVYELHKNRLNILRFCVHPDHRLRGIGRQMFDKLVVKLHQQRRRALTALVNEQELDAQKFFRALGFRVRAIERGTFGENDGYRFEWHLPQEALASEDDER